MPLSSEPKKLTKAQNKKVLDQFLNLCNSLKNLSQDFIVSNIEDIKRKNLDDNTKSLIAFKAKAVRDEVENTENSKIVLPAEWETLVDLADPENV